MNFVTYLVAIATAGKEKSEYSQRASYLHNL